MPASCFSRSSATPLRVRFSKITASMSSPQLTQRQLSHSSVFEGAPPVSSSQAINPPHRRHFMTATSLLPGERPTARGDPFILSSWSREKGIPRTGCLPRYYGRPGWPDGTRRPPTRAFTAPPRPRRPLRENRRPAPGGHLILVACPKEVGLSLVFSIDLDPSKNGQRPPTRAMLCGGIPCDEERRDDEVHLARERR